MEQYPSVGIIGEKERETPQRVSLFSALQGLLVSAVRGVVWWGVRTVRQGDLGGYEMPRIQENSIERGRRGWVVVGVGGCFHLIQLGSSQVRQIV